MGVEVTAEHHMPEIPVLPQAASQLLVGLGVASCESGKYPTPTKMGLLLPSPLRVRVSTRCHMV